jgi:glutathione S-transferase
MNLKARRPGFKIWSGARADIDRITTIWRECFEAYHGPYLFGKLTMADAMYAPVVTRFLNVPPSRSSTSHASGWAAHPRKWQVTPRACASGRRGRPRRNWARLR